MFTGAQSHFRPLFPATVATVLLHSEAGIGIAIIEIVYLAGCLTGMALLAGGILTVYYAQPTGDSASLNRTALVGYSPLPHGLRDRRGARAYEVPRRSAACLGGRHGINYGDGDRG